MKLLIATWEFPPIKGGIGVYLCSLVNFMAGRGHRIVVLAPQTAVRNQFNCHPNVSFCEFLSVSRGWLDCLSQGTAIARLSAKTKPDFILPGNEDSLVATGLFQALIHTPVLPLFHGSEIRQAWGKRSFKSAVKRRAFKRLARISVGAFTNSDYTRSLLTETNWFRHVPVFTLPGAVEDDLLHREVEAGAVDHLLTRGVSGVPALLSVSRLVPRKGIDVTLRALAALRQEGLLARYVIAGEGESRAELEDLTRSLSLTDQVVFAGEVSEAEKIALLDTCDLFVLPSREAEGGVEGFGLVFLEAAARGKPAIGGRHGGVGESIVDGLTGFLADPLEPGDVANKIRRLVTDPELAKKMGAAGRQRCQREMTWSVRTAQLEDILEGLTRDRQSVERAQEVR